jgi:hypothetical protein
VVTGFSKVTRVVAPDGKTKMASEDMMGMVAQVFGDEGVPVVGHDGKVEPPVSKH